MMGYVFTPLVDPRIPPKKASYDGIKHLRAAPSYLVRSSDIYLIPIG